MLPDKVWKSQTISRWRYLKALWGSGQALGQNLQFFDQQALAV